MSSSSLPFKSKVQIYWGNLVCTVIVSALTSPFVVGTAMYFGWGLSWVAITLGLSAIALISFAVASGQVRQAAADRRALALIVHGLELPLLTSSEPARADEARLWR